MGPSKPESSRARSSDVDAGVHVAWPFALPSSEAVRTCAIFYGEASGWSLVCVGMMLATSWRVWSAYFDIRLLPSCKSKSDLLLTDVHSETTLPVDPTIQVYAAIWSWHA